MSILAHLIGLLGVAVLVLGLLAVIIQWRIAFFWWLRPVVLVLGAASFCGLLYLVKREFIFAAYVYITFIFALAVAHLFAAFATMNRFTWQPPADDPRYEVPPIVRQAMVHERALNYVAAVASYDEYLDAFPDDARVRARLAEALIKAGNAKRAISVLTVAFTQAEDAKAKISLGIRLAELTLVAERNPLAARAQLEQLKLLFAGTEHEKLVEGLSNKLLKRVAEGRYLKPKPHGPS